MNKNVFRLAIYSFALCLLFSSSSYAIFLSDTSQLLKPHAGFITAAKPHADDGMPLNKTELRRAFLQVVFGNRQELDIVNPYANLLKKLSDREDTSVVVFLPEHLPNRLQYYNRVISIFEEFSAFTGINFLYDNSKTNQMMLIFIGDETYVDSSAGTFASQMGVADQYLAFRSILQPDRPLCFALGFPHARNKASVGISMTGIETRYFEKCIYTQIFRMLGLNNDLEIADPTSLDAVVDNTYPNNLDWYLLRLLYDNRFEAGMGIQEVEDILDQILSD